jgi:Bacterial SH3 domain
MGTGRGIGEGNEGKEREALATGASSREAPAPGKQSHSERSSPPLWGNSSVATGHRKDGALAASRVDDWGMSPELSSALGLCGLEESEPQGYPSAQRSPLSAPGWAQSHRKAQDPESADAAQPTTSLTLAFVREEGLNLRAGPDQKTSSLLQMKFGQRVHVLDDSGKREWLKIVVLGQTGYVYKPRIHFPPADLIAKDPGLALVEVKSGQTFWGLVKDRYGIQGNESSKDQNINHFINAIRAVNKPEAFKVKTGLLDDISNAVVPGRDASDTELTAGVDLWIPSFGVAAKMDVGSGTATGEVTRYVKKLDQKIEDFGAACKASGKHIPGAIARNAGEMAMGMVDGLVDFALDAAKILSITTGVGALLGAAFGGAGAIPGAEIGFEIGLLILEYYGLYMLAEAIFGVAGNLLSQLGSRGTPTATRPRSTRPARRSLRRWASLSRPS